MKILALLSLAVLLLPTACAAQLTQSQDAPARAIATPPDTATQPAQTTTTQAASQPTDEEEDKGPMSAGTFAGLKLRSIGPALMSGRVADFAVDPQNRRHYFVAVASGGVWKTTNAGTTWKPVFDGQGSYSIGCVTMDPQNPSVVWVGTGENNSQRSVGFGDGVYRSRDGGNTWENVGLKESEHIGMITIDPRDSNSVYVAAQGPLWRAGGERGLYKTSDGGASWQRILHISDDTGVNEIHLDPRNPDVLYASAYQRRRHTWTLIDGGPESAIYKSTDAGQTWRKINRGLPEVELGRIGLAVSPAKPDVVYAIVEAADGQDGFFRSTDRGETWEKRSGYKTTSAQYYNEIVCDPLEAERVYVLDTVLHVTNDGGATFRPVPRQFRHVDDHALWIDPGDNDYLLVGCDGGVYESLDRGESWNYKPNLPVTQFYRVSVDNSTPFYFVYGGTQDNNSVGGPSRTTDRIGIANEHWFVTVGGDGYETQVDPEDPNTVYSQWQYGGLVRYDRRSGEILDIKPRELPGEEGYRWNWDSPLLLSPHDHKRLYFAANILFRSDDRGVSWTAISGDLTRQIDRNQLEVMGRIQPPDAVDKHNHTSFYGNCVALSESPLVEDLLYVGTDDGLVQVTENGGQTWRRIESFPGVPDMSYVSCLTASRHDANTVYAAFDNHKQGDFKPYLLVSNDRGHTWTSIAGDLPERDCVYSIAQDHVKPEILFAGTEFGAYFTVDGGQKWIRLTGGVPTIAVRDIAIQRRENDLVLGTFGRGFYILDDYTPLRHVSEETLERDVLVFPVKDALRYIESNRLGGGSGRGSQGAAFFAAENPPYGAVFTYYRKEKLTTRKERRHEAEKEAVKAGRTQPYPTLDELRAEDEEKEPTILLTVRDEDGEVVRRLSGPREKGIHRVAWDLRYPASTPISLSVPQDRPPWWRPPSGPLTLPGAYTVTLAKRVDGVITPLADPQPFQVIPLELATFAATERPAVLAFQKRVARLQRAVQGALRAADDAQNRLAHIRGAITETPEADLALLAETKALEQRLRDLLIRLRGDSTRQKRMEPTPPSINERVQQIVGQWNTTTVPTQTHHDAYRYAGAEFAEMLPALRTLIETDLKALEARLEAAGAPWTPGRIPVWEME
ncbi:MAG: glycosyl hydrolase [Planctomycetes bacterium]|nr:glycosyl hydrolase [Planctomycetota bacterium]